MLVQGDERTVLQIVLNLILNAEDALAGQPRRELRLTVGRDAAVGTITVADTGHGVEDGIRACASSSRSSRRAAVSVPSVLDCRLPASSPRMPAVRCTLRDAAPGATTFVVELPLA